MRTDLVTVLWDRGGTGVPVSAITWEYVGSVMR